MLATAPRTADRRLEAPDLELILDALGERERNIDERPRLRRIRIALELELADRLEE